MKDRRNSFFGRVQERGAIEIITRCDARIQSGNGYCQEPPLPNGRCRKHGKNLPKPVKELNRQPPQKAADSLWPELNELWGILHTSVSQNATNAEKEAGQNAIALLGILIKAGKARSEEDFQKRLREQAEEPFKQEKSA